tara:strand:- start:80 stop:403 length:324 start_codon:yes stop_codon:yes gene_type:complete
MKTLEISRWSKYSEKPERSKNIWLHHDDKSSTKLTLIENEKGNEEAGYITDTAMFVGGIQPLFEGYEVVRVEGLSSGTIAVGFGADNHVYMSREQAVEMMSQLTEIL